MPRKETNTNPSFDAFFEGLPENESEIKGFYWPKVQYPS